ncbi:MAG: NAD-binding protein [Pseudomonadota bacterium]
MKIIIAGAGEVGRHLAGLLSRRGDDVVLLDRRPAPLALAEEELDVQILAGDVTFRSVLARAEVPGSDAFIAVTGSDEANMLAAALARGMGARIAVARVDQPDFYLVGGGLERDVLGVDHVLCTTRLACAELLTRIASTQASFAHSFAAGRVQVGLWPVAHGDPACAAIPAQLGVREGAVLGGVLRDGFFRRPEEIPRTEEGDLLLLAGEPEAVDAGARQLVGRRGRDRHLVVGGSELGALVAGVLAARGLRVDLIDRDPARCRELAAELPQVKVLLGDATDPAFMKDIRFDECEGVVSVTHQEEVNLLTSMLVRQLDNPAVRGTPHAWVSVHRPGYADICRRLGIEGTTSSFEVLSRAILEAVAPPGIVASEALPDSAWSVVDARLAPALVPGLTVADLPLPGGAVPLAIGRGTASLTPRPERELAGGDNLILACPTRELRSLSTALRGVAAGEARP